MAVSANDLNQVRKVQELVGKWGKHALWSGMTVSLGGTGVAVAGAYLDDNGKLDIDDHTPPGNTENK